ncbi:hypothetical protein QYE76_026324 [Lolium multiflorum]|uniref:DUF4219 domain-containing protein n=1 Tax=Lolium multiflorum TaxID=4521 RepID=A0AAD8VV18_LOLMU|nr:hypothetical protein QYE76_026324 [Lolium multiflorum]
MADEADKAKATELVKKMAEEKDLRTPPTAQLTDGSGSSSGGEVRVVERVVRHNSVVAATPLMLTRTNYSDWALIMRVQLHGQWEVVERLPRQP